MSADTRYAFTGWSARRLKCTPDGVRYLERTGKLKAALIVNGVRLFDRADVERLAQERAGSDGKARKADAIAERLTA